MSRSAAAWLVAAAFLCAPPASAQPPAWPSRVVKVIVPQAGGGGTDLLARALAERLQPRLGQPVIVETRPGAGGNIGTEFVARQPPDGHTVLVTSVQHVTHLVFMKKLPYDPVRDFEPVSLIATIPFVMVVNASFPARTVTEFIEAARARRGMLAYASGGIGTTHHLAAEMLKAMTGIEMTHVPYKGSAPVVAALLANEVAVSISAVNSMLPYVRSGRLRPLATATKARTPLMPELPTIAEAVPLPGYGIDVWYGVLLPAGSPRPVVERLAAEINRIVRDAEFGRERLAAVGMEAVGTTPEEFLEVIKADIVKYRNVARDARIVAE